MAATDSQPKGHGPEPELSQEENLDIKALKFIRPEEKAPKTPSTPDGDDGSDEEEDKGQILDRYRVLETMSKDGATVRNQKSFESFTLRHYQNVKELIRDEKGGRNLCGNLLHAILERQVELSNWKLLVKFILDVDKDMSVSGSATTNSASKTSNLLILQRKDSNGNTCLHEAIESRHSGLDFIRHICAVADHNDLRSAIATENSRDQSCIHLAITQLHAKPPSSQDKPRQQDIMDFFRLSSLQILKHLADHADGDVLGKAHKTKTEDSTEGLENLPLHDLVHISLCKGLDWRCPKREHIGVCEKCSNFTPTLDEYHKTYLAVVDILVKKYPDALKKLNQSNLSPFLFHRNTRDKNSATRSWGSLEFVEPSDGDQVPSEDQGRRSSVATPQPTSVETKDGQAKDSHDDTLGESATTSQQKHKHPQPEISKALATTVSRKLLDFCLSQSKFTETCDTLFGKRFPSSELISKAAPLTAKTMDLHRHLPLEPMLACVELGLYDDISLTTEITGPARRTQVERDRKSREARVLKLFQWLRDKRNVRKIVRLVVHDHPEAPCRDEVIKSCLRDFDIRYLDWNKEDISIDLVQSVAPNLRELWLTWSGRNSTLLGWCNEKYGLRLLKGSLGRLYVSISGEWETQETNEENYRQFTDNLKEENNMPDLKVHDETYAASGIDDSSNRLELPGVKAGNPWVDAVNKFRKSLSQKLAKSEKLDAMNGAVTIAIVDDGVDLEQLKTAAYVTGGWYPDRKEPDRGNMNSWYISEKNHGTEIAKLIQLIWPYLNLYVAKLDTGRRAYETVAASAAEAINRAIDNKANVICMSWTIYRNEAGNGNDEGLEAMKRAIERAAKYKILMFCASQDAGYSAHRRPYPASERDTRALKRIGSATVYGERSEYVDPGEADYLFPGEVAMSDEKVCSGSSAATALASGLAGLILWCCSLQRLGSGNVERSKSATIKAGNGKDFTPGGLRRPDSKLTPPMANTSQPQDEHVDFQSYERMYGLFDSLCSENKKNGNNPFVNITRFLHTAAEDPDPARKLVELCKAEVHKLFDEKSGSKF